MLVGHSAEEDGMPDEETTEIASAVNKTPATARMLLLCLQSRQAGNLHLCYSLFSIKMFVCFGQLSTWKPTQIQLKRPLVLVVTDVRFKTIRYFVLWLWVCTVWVGGVPHETWHPSKISTLLAAGQPNGVWSIIFCQALLSVKIRRHGDRRDKTSSDYITTRQTSCRVWRKSAEHPNGSEVCRLIRSKLDANQSPFTFLPLVLSRIKIKERHVRCRKIMYKMRCDSPSIHTTCSRICCWIKGSGIASIKS